MDGRRGRQRVEEGGDSWDCLISRRIFEHGEEQRPRSPVQKFPFDDVDDDDDDTVMK